jgi:hypothetical protein
MINAYAVRSYVKASLSIDMTPLVCTSDSISFTLENSSLECIGFTIIKCSYRGPLEAGVRSKSI